MKHSQHQWQPVAAAPPNTLQNPKFQQQFLLYDKNTMLYKPLVKEMIHGERTCALLRT